MLEASLFGLSTVQALVVLFVLLPIAAGAVIVPLVSWRIKSTSPPVRTSEILANGIPVTARIVTVKTLGSILEVRPMVRFVVRVSPPCSPPWESFAGEQGGPMGASGGAGGEPFDLEIVQSLPRAVIGNFRSGDTVQAKLTADFSAGAIVWESWT